MKNLKRVEELLVEYYAAVTDGVNGYDYTSGDLAGSYAKKIAATLDRPKVKKVRDLTYDERKSGDDEMAQLERIAELEELVRDWQVLYENPDLSGYTRLRNRTLNLGIEVVDE